MNLLTPSVLPHRRTHRRFTRGRACAVAQTRERRSVAGARTSSVPSLRSLVRRPSSLTTSAVRGIDKARRLMAEQDLGAIVLEPGTSMAYFVNVRWGLSERPFLLVIPAKGELAYVAPAFEENRAREITKFTDDVRVWQEDEDRGGRRRGHPEGTRRRDRQGGRRGTRALLHRRRSAQGRARDRVDAGDARHGGLPDDQVGDRDRADAARQRHHARRRTRRGSRRCTRA